MDDFFTCFGEGFFAEGGKAGLESGEGLFVMEVGGGGDDDAIESGSGEGLFQGGDDVRCGEKAIADGRGAGGEGIKENGEFGASVRDEAFGMEHGDLAAADHGQLQTTHEYFPCEFPVMP